MIVNKKEDLNGPTYAPTKTGLNIASSLGLDNG